MPHLLLNIDMQNRNALVVGGGKVARRKINTLLASGACVRVVSPAAVPDIVQLAASGAISVREGCYCPSDLEGIFLVVAATDNAAVNSQIVVDAMRHNVLVAVADAPETGNCRFPAILRRGKLEIGVSTGGLCPAFAVQVKVLLGKIIGESYGEALEELIFEREKLLTERNDSTYNKKLLNSLAERLLKELQKNKEIP